MRCAVRRFLVDVVVDLHVAVDVDVDDVCEASSPQATEHRDDPHQETLAAVEGLIVRSVRMLRIN